MAVRRLLQNIGDPDRLKGARPVLDDDPPPLACGKFGRNDATEKSGGEPGLSGRRYGVAFDG